PVIVDGQTICFHAPANDFRIQRLAHAQDVAQTLHAVLPGNLLAFFHEHAQRGWSCVPDCDLHAIDERVPAVRVESAFVTHDGGTERPGAEDTIYGARHPTGIGRAPVDVVVPEIEHPLRGHVMTDDVVVNVNDAFRFSGCAGSVEKIEGIFGIHLLA